MNYFEARIAQNQRRLDRIRSNPDPTKLRTNELYYELGIKTCQDMLERWRNNKLLCATMDQAAIFAAMGIPNVPYMGAANNSAIMRKDYFAILRRHGYPDQTCDMCVLPIALCLEGDLPWPSMVSVWTHACDRESYIFFTGLATAAGCPEFRLDSPLSADYEAIHYLGEQLGGLIEWVEATFPGVKYDEDDLIRRIEHEAEVTQLKRQQYELRKRVPSPISGQDVLRMDAGGFGMGGSAESLEYTRMQTEEVAERAAKGIGSVTGEEKLRVAWLATEPFGTGVFDMLHKKGVSVPWYNHGSTALQYGFHDYAWFAHYGDENEFKCKLTPLEEVSRRTIHNSWASRGLERWVKVITEVCRDLRIDAVIQFLHIGCVTTGGLAKVLADTIEKELGIPVLSIQGSQNDWDAEREREFERNISEFVDLCLAKKR